MKIFKSIVVLGVAVMTFVQCAEKENEDYDVREQAVFDEWMSRNHPAAERQESGMYVQWHEPRSTSSVKPGATDWVALDYRGYDLRGNMISNRDSAIARREGTFTLRTHYVPHIAVADPAGYLEEKDTYYNYAFTAGEYEILKQMSVGDSVRIYLPSMMAYRTTSTYFQYGYEGWYNSSLNPKNSSSVPTISGSPVVIDLALRGIVSDPEKKELAEVQAKASELEMKLVQDTIPGFYFKYLEEEDITKDIIGEDSTFYMLYDIRFLDNFLIATNDYATAFVEWEDFSTSREPTGFIASSSSLSSYFGAAINELIKSEKIRYESRIKVLFVSEWGYYSGLEASSTNPVVYPYTPLIMEIVTLEYGYDPDGEDEEDEE